MSRPASILVDRRARTHQGLSVGVAVCPNTQVHLGVLHCPDQNAIPTDCTPLTLEQRCCTWWMSTAHADGVCVHSRAQGAPCSRKDPACTRWPRLGSGRRVPSARRPICCLPSPLPLTSRRERTYGLRYSGNTDVENCAINYPSWGFITMEMPWKSVDKTAQEWSWHTLAESKSAQPTRAVW